MTRNGQLLENLVLFGRVLHNNGLDVSTRQMVILLRALDHIQITDREDFYNACLTVFVHHRSDIPVFKTLFDDFWRPPDNHRISLGLPGPLPLEKGNTLREERAGSSPQEPSQDHSEDDLAPLQLDSSQMYSSSEILRQKDFSSLSPDELIAVKRMIKELVQSVALRRTRRWRYQGMKNIELRRTIRKNLQYGGEILEWVRLDPKWKPRPVIALADISGSMQRYTEVLLHFLINLSAGLKKLEAFVFGTRLTRITPHLASSNIDASLDRISKNVLDWSGGTRIGWALREFNYRWARRVSNRGALVMLISDGWDRGEPALLGKEVARLQRTCHRLIWLNPLLGLPEYKPLTRGIQAALPFIDDHLAVHNFHSLEALTRHLRDIPPKRMTRRQQHLARLSQVVP